MPPETSLADLVARYRAGEVVVTSDEAKPWLFLKCSRASFYRAMGRGEVPGTLRLGHSYRLQLGTLIKWIASVDPDDSGGNGVHE